MQKVCSKLLKLLITFYIESYFLSFFNYYKKRVGERFGLTANESTIEWVKTFNFRLEERIFTVRERSESKGEKEK